MHAFKLLALSALLFAAAAVALPASRSKHSPAKPNAAVKGKWFDRIVVINLENTDFGVAMRAPFLKTLTTQAVLLNAYYAITHPSLPNYVSQIYGSDYNLSDDSVHNIPGKSLMDLLEAGGVSWKTYQENYPGNCFTSSSTRDGLYYRKHNPFLMMNNVHNNPDLCKKVVDEKQLDADIKANQVPQVVYYTPNMNNDGHDTGVNYASDWLETFLASRRDVPALSDGTLYFVTFDEQDDYSGDNKVYSVLFGSPVKGREGTVDNTKYTHFSLTRTIEDNWSLGNLGRSDATAAPFKL